MKLTIHTDGGSLNNPGQAGIGFLVHEGDKHLYKHAEAIGIASNNVAEYTALIRALTYVIEHIDKNQGVVTSVRVIADSQLMIKQLNGEYKVKNQDMKPLYAQVKQLERELGISISYIHVLREQNAEADALVKAALGK